MRRAPRTLRAWLFLAGAFSFAASSGSTAVEGEEVEVDFVSEVLPLVQGSCLQCHRATHRDEAGRLRRPKGKLRLDGRSGFLQGGGEGPAIVRGEPASSPLIQRVSLPEEHEDFMPVEGEPWSAEQVARVARWIEEGADFGDWDRGGEPEAGPAGPEVPARVKRLQELARGVRAVDPAVLDGLRARGVRIVPALPGTALLRIGFPAHERHVDDALVKALAPLKEVVTELDLGRTAIGDEAVGVVAGFSRLTRLDLSGTAITIDGVRLLFQHPQLHALVLHGVVLDDRVFSVLGSMPKLESASLWQTDVSEKAASRFRAARHDFELVTELVLPETADEARQRRR